MLVIKILKVIDIKYYEVLNEKNKKKNYAI